MTTSIRGYRAVRLTLAGVALFIALLSAVTACLALYNLFNHINWSAIIVMLSLLALSATTLWLSRWLFRIRSPTFERNVALGTLSTCIVVGVCLGLIELVLAFALPAMTYSQAKSFSPSIFKASTILPFELRPGYRQTIYDFESGNRTEFTVNSLGFRGPEFAPEKPDGVYRILLLGDSFAVNNALPDHQLHTVLLERKLNGIGGSMRFQVINCGYADGFSPDAYIAFMLQRGFALDPDMVVMQYFVRNDFMDLLETEVLEYHGDLPLRVRSKTRYVDEAGQLRRSNWLKYRIPVLREMHLYVHLYDLVEVDSIISRLTAVLVPNFVGDNFSRNSYGITYRDVYKPAHERHRLLQDAFDQSLQYVRAFAAETAARGVKFTLFIVPTGVQMSPDLWRAQFSEAPPVNWDHPDPQKQISDGLIDGSIDVLDPLVQFRKAGNRETLYLGDDKDGHWNHAGARVAAEVLYEHIATRLAPQRSSR